MKGKLTFSQEEWQSKDLLPHYIKQHASDEDIHFLLAAGQSKLMEKTQHCTASGGQKHKWMEEGGTWHTAQRTEENIDESMDIDENGDDVYESEKFLVLPEKEELNDQYVQFYQAMSYAAVKLGICGICTWGCSVVADQLQDISLFEIPNNHHLVLTKPHPAHHNQLFDGKLLEPADVKLVNNQPTITVYYSCLEDLKKAGSKPLKHSLANQLWIDPIVWQLQILMFPKQLLITLLYPWVYIFKLFSK